MQRIVGIVGAMLLVAAGITPQAKAGPAQTATAESDRAMFVRYCASCHGRNGRGDGPVADGFRMRPGDLTQFARRNGGSFPAEQTRRIIDGREAHLRSHGPSDMPVWGDAFIRRDGLSEQAARARIEAIVRFLESIQERSGH